MCGSSMSVDGSSRLLSELKSDPRRRQKRHSRVAIPADQTQVLNRGRDQIVIVAPVGVVQYIGGLKVHRCLEPGRQDGLAQTAIHALKRGQARLVWGRSPLNRRQTNRKTAAGGIG